MTDEVVVGNVISRLPWLGPALCVFDHRPETLEFLESCIALARKGGGLE